MSILLYLPVTSLEKANELSSLFWQLTNPANNKTTKRYSTPIVKNTTGEVVLPLSSKGFRINPDAEKDLFTAFLQEFVDLGIITQEEVMAVEDLIGEKAKERAQVNLQEMLPGYWYSSLLTKEDMVNRGWFSNEEN